MTHGSRRSELNRLWEDMLRLAAAEGRHIFSDDNATQSFRKFYRRKDTKLLKVNFSSVCGWITYGDDYSPGNRIFVLYTSVRNPSDSPGYIDRMVDLLSKMTSIIGFIGHGYVMMSCSSECIEELDMLCELREI